MAQTKFYRGVDKTSLPENRRDGAIYIIDTGESSDTGSINDGRGEMYVDIGSRRLQISPPASAANIKSYTESDIARIGGSTSSLGNIYLIVSDTLTDEKGNPLEIGYKIGDGNAFIRDLPMVDFLKVQKYIQAYADSTTDNVNKDPGDIRLILNADISYSN